MSLKEKIEEVLESPMLLEKIAEEIKNDDSGKLPESLKSQPLEVLVEVAKTMVKEMPKDKLINIFKKVFNESKNNNVIPNK